MTRRATVSKAAPSAEVALLLWCAASGFQEGTAELTQIAAKVGDWRRLLELAAKHAIIPIVSRQLSRIQPGIVPDDIGRDLQSAAWQGALRNLELAGQLAAVLHEFAQCGIDSIPVKGPTLATLVYGDLSLRLFTDLDVLVQKPDFARATVALRALEFRPAPRPFDDWRDSLLLEEHHEVFLHADSDIPLELHRSLVHRTLAEASLEESWWHNRQFLDLGGAAVGTLGPESLLLYLCLHGAKHSWARIGWLCDLHRSLKQFADVQWDVIWQLAEKHGLTRIVAVGLILVEELLDGAALTNVAFSGRSRDRVSEVLAARIRRRLLLSPDMSPSIDFMLQMRLRDRLRDRFRYAVYILAEPWPADVTALELPRKMRGIYYVLRPFRLALKYLGSLLANARIA
jgi:hypothetical protein